jgi:tetratricopeptide (TPR) repeat protein
MRRWSWTIAFSAICLTAHLGLAQTLHVKRYGSHGLKISEPGKLGPGSRSSKVEPHLSLVVDLGEVSRQVASDEKELPRDGEARFKKLIELSRLYFILGDLGSKAEGKPARRKYFDKGYYYAELLRRSEPRRVEGHYWLALNLAGLAEVGGAGLALRLLPTIVNELKVARSIDEAYDQAGPDRLLGRLYCLAPPWPLSVGDLNQSLQVLRAAVKIAPNNSTNHLFLAETLLQLHQTKEAFRQLKQVLKSTNHTIWDQGLKDDRQQALRLMKKYKRA